MRDWRPIEFVMADVGLLKECGKRLREEKFAQIIPGKDGIPMWNDEARTEFPDLSFLLSGFECGIYPTLQENPILKEIYQEIEKHLHKLVEEVERQLNNPGTRRKKIDFVGDDEDPVMDWFFGQWGDEGFVTTESNDRRLLKWVTAKISKEKEGVQGHGENS